MHIEFVVPGPPISNQRPGPNLTAWKASVAAEAKSQYGGKTILKDRLKEIIIIINFHLGPEPSVDVDNMSKPIFDALQGIVYEDDRQIRQAELTHVRIDAPFVFVGASKILVAAVQTGNLFVYVRIEDPIDPFPLPK